MLILGEMNCSSSIGMDCPSSIFIEFYRNLSNGYCQVQAPKKWIFMEMDYLSLIHVTFYRILSTTIHPASVSNSSFYAKFEYAYSPFFNLNLGVFQNFLNQVKVF